MKGNENDHTRVCIYSSVVILLLSILIENKNSIYTYSGN